MNLPNVGNSHLNERLGISALQMYAAKNGQIWRETNSSDVGIDGQLEYVSNGYATGRLVAVQSKSGLSYFQHSTSNGWKFYPAEKHLRYWEAFALPVILTLHNPDDEKTYWVDVQRSLRTQESSKNKSVIEVSNESVLEETRPEKIFERTGVIIDPFLSNTAYIEDISQVFHELTKVKSLDGSFPLSYFELFCHGLTNLCRSIYFGADCAINIVEYNFYSIEEKQIFGYGFNCDFLFGFVQFLIVHDLAKVDYSDCLIDWVDRQKLPQFVAPLTSRGRQLVKYIQSIEDQLIQSSVMSYSKYRVAQEGFFKIDIESTMFRFPRIMEFQKSLN